MTAASAAVRATAAAAQVAPRPTAPPTKGHLPALDGLRGVAIVAVLCLHFATQLDLAPTGAVSALLLRIASFGWTGVNLFFALSGFLITGILLDARGGAGYYRAFYARRALRIWPLYFAFLLFEFVVLPRLGVGGGENWERARAHQGWYWAHQTNVMMAVRSLAPRPDYPTTLFWSLAVEEQFYLLWPAVVSYASRATLARICLWGVGASLALRVIAVAAGVSHDAIYFLTPFRLDAILLGAYAAIRLRDETGAALLRRWWARAAAIALGALACAALALGRLDFADAFTATVGDMLIAILSAALVVGAAMAPAHWIGRVLRTGGLRLAGRLSYAMYVFHTAAIAQFKRFVPFGALRPVLGSIGVAQVLYFGTWVGEVVLLAAASWLLFERPILRLKRLVPYGAGARPARGPRRFDVR